MQTIELAYEQFGDAAGDPLIILHGFLASSRNWRSVAKRLAARRRVYVLDMRNHGASPHHAAMDYPSMAMDVAAFIESRNLNRSHVLGHSMGGKIAMWLALHRPDLVRRLIVADISPVSYQHSFDPVIQALRQLPLHSLGNRKDAERHLESAIPELGFRQFLLQNLLFENERYFWRINLDIIAATGHNIVAFPEPEAAAYSVPALFIAGERSAYVRPDAILRHFPLARIETIANTGHWLYVEEPAIFTDLVDAWLADS